MLARLSLRLRGKVSYRQASLLQGVIMEKISPYYAEFLHGQNMHPYSQYVYIDDNKNIWWVIQTLNKDAYENIIKVFDGNIQEIVLLKDGKNKLEILEKKFESVNTSNLLEDFYTPLSNRKFEIEFLTPTAFRQNKRYVILPDIHLIAQSLMLKFSQCAEFNMMDEDALEHIALNSFISKHNIRSLSFPLEGTYVPGFIGNITLSCSANETMANFLKLLLSFGEFSGMGIKTGMGMGAFKIKKE